MDTTGPYVGDHTPMVKVGPEGRGIQQAGLALRKGRSYTGRVVLAGTAGAAVRVALVWGTAPTDRSDGPPDRRHRQARVRLSEASVAVRGGGRHRRRPPGDRRDRNRQLSRGCGFADAGEQRAGLPGGGRGRAPAAAVRSLPLPGRQLRLRPRVARRHRRSRPASAHHGPGLARGSAQRRRHRRVHDPVPAAGRRALRDRQRGLRRRVVRRAARRVRERSRHHPDGAPARRQWPSRAVPRQVLGRGQRALGRLAAGFHAARAVRAEARPVRQGDAAGGSDDQADCRRLDARRDDRLQAAKASQRPDRAGLPVSRGLERRLAVPLPGQHRSPERALLLHQQPAVRPGEGREGPRRVLARRVDAPARDAGPGEVRALPGVPEAHPRAPAEAGPDQPGRMGVHRRAPRLVQGGAGLRLGLPRDVPPLRPVPAGRVHVRDVDDQREPDRRRPEPDGAPLQDVPGALRHHPRRGVRGLAAAEAGVPGRRGPAASESGERHLPAGRERRARRGSQDADLRGAEPVGCRTTARAVDRWGFGSGRRAALAHGAADRRRGDRGGTPALETRTSLQEGRP